jgi:hypothetical protein
MVNPDAQDVVKGLILKMRLKLGNDQVARPQAIVLESDKNVVAGHPHI